MDVTRRGYALGVVPMRHPMPCYGVRVHADGALLAYSGDTNTCDALANLLEGEPDVALVDACFSDAQWGEGKPHLSARLAAQAMESAGVKHPLLTHLPPDGDTALLLTQAREACPRAMWAAEGARIAVRG
jgi:ribonuclease BN (tRNA processing enzyme)